MHRQFRWDLLCRMVRGPHLFRVILEHRFHRLFLMAPLLRKALLFHLGQHYHLLPVVLALRLVHRDLFFR